MENNARITKIAHNHKSGTFLMYFGNIVIGVLGQEDDMEVLIDSLGNYTKIETETYTSYIYENL